MTATLTYTDCGGEQTLIASTYTDADRTHHVVVDHYRGAWTVFDAAAANPDDQADGPFTSVAVIDRVAGSIGEALAIAANYLHEMERYLAGERDAMTVPHPAPEPDEIVFTKASNMPDGLRALHDGFVKPKAVRRLRPVGEQQTTLEMAA